jgi:hypothetical protein
MTTHTMARPRPKGKSIPNTLPISTEHLAQVATSFKSTYGHRPELKANLQYEEVQDVFRRQEVLDRLTECQKKQIFSQVKVLGYYLIAKVQEALKILGANFQDPSKLQAYLQGIKDPVCKTKNSLENFSCMDIQAFTESLRDLYTQLSYASQNPYLVVASGSSPCDIQSNFNETHASLKVIHVFLKLLLGNACALENFQKSKETDSFDPLKNRKDDLDSYFTRPRDSGRSEFGNWAVPDIGSLKPCSHGEGYTLFVQLDHAINKEGYEQWIRQEMQKEPSGFICIDIKNRVIHVFNGNIHEMAKTSKLHVVGHGSGIRQTISGYLAEQIWRVLFTNTHFSYIDYKTNKRGNLNNPLIQVCPNEIYLNSCEVGNQDLQIPKELQFGEQLKQALYKQTNCSVFPKVIAYTTSVSFLADNGQYLPAPLKKQLFVDKMGNIVGSEGKKIIYSDRSFPLIEDTPILPYNCSGQDMNTVELKGKSEMADLLL